MPSSMECLCPLLPRPRTSSLLRKRTARLLTRQCPRLPRSRTISARCSTARILCLRPSMRLGRTRRKPSPLRISRPRFTSTSLKFALACFWSPAWENFFWASLSNFLFSYFIVEPFISFVECFIVIFFIFGSNILLFFLLNVMDVLFLTCSRFHS